MTYKPSPYIEPLILPPQVDPSMLDRGEFRLCFSPPKYLVQTPQAQQVRFKLWGEQFSRFASFGVDVVFRIKCSNANFAAYLRDMKILRAELVDCRNGCLVGTVLVNLLLFVNPAPMSSEADCPFLPAKETFDIVKQNLLKTKLGGLQIRMESWFGLTRNQETVREFANPEYKQRSSPYMLSPVNCDSNAGVQSISFKKQTRTLIQYANSNSRQDNNYPSAMGLQPTHVQSSHRIYPFQPKTRQPQITKGDTNNKQSHQLSCLLHYQPINVQANVAKLRMETNELLNTSISSTTVQHPKQLHIRVVKAIMSSPESLSLVLEYPQRAGYQDFKTIHTEVPACGSNKQQVRYNSYFCITDYRGMEGQSIKFWFKNRRKDQVVGYAQCILDDMAYNDETVIPIRSKSQKEIGRICLRIGSSKQDVMKNKDVQNGAEFPRHNQPGSKNVVMQRPRIQLMVLINITKGVLLNQETDSTLYYKVVFRLQKEGYETAMLKRMNWNYRLATCINPSTRVEDPFILFELWGEGAASRLLGIGKWATQDLLKLLENGVVQANLQPIALYDSNLPIQSIDTRQNIGYLSLGINVGTPKQISKLIHTVPSLQPRMNQPTKQSPPVSDPSPNSATERQPTSSQRDEQNKSKFSLQHQPSSLQSQRPPQLNKHSVIQINSLMDTITNFFSAISDSRHRIQLILKEINLSADVKLDQFQRILQNILEEYEEYWDALAFFYGDGELVNTLEFLKSFSSFVNFKDILIEELTSLLLDLNAELSKSNTGLDVLENKLLLYSQFGFVSNSNFKEVFRPYKISSLLLDRILQTYSSTKQNQLIVSEFMDHLKSCKFNRPIQKLSYNLVNLQLLIQNSVVEVVTLEAETVMLIATTLSTKTLDPKSVCQLLETLQIDVSIWQALLLIESVKIFFKQDLDLVEGQVSSIVMIEWLKSVVAMGGLPKADSVGQITEPDVVNLRTERTDTNPDDIANIASLLKEKDKYDYDDSSAPRNTSQPPQMHFNVQVLKVLEGSLLSLPLAKKPIVAPLQAPITSERESRRSYQPPSQRTQTSTEARTPRLRYLKYNVLEVKLDIDVNFLTIDLGVLLQNQVLMKKQKGILKFYSPKTFFQYVDVNNIQFYKSKTKGLGITAKGYLRDSETSLKGLISLQDIGKITSQTKKVCILYNNQMNIVGRVILEVDFVDREQQLPSIQKQYLLLRVLSVQSPSTPCEISFQLNSSTKLHSLQLRKQYQVQMDNLMFKARCGFILKCSDHRLEAQFSIQSLLLGKSLKFQLPLLKQNSEYCGMILVQMSIREEEEVVTQIESEPMSRYTAFVFLDHLVSLSRENRNINVNISIFNQFSVPSYQKHSLRLSEPTACIPIESVFCVQSFKSQLPVTIQLTDLDTKIQFGSGKFKVDARLSKELCYMPSKQIRILNRLDIPMECSIRLLVIQRTEEPRLHNIIQQLRLDKLNTLLSKLDQVSGTSMRGVFKDLKISFSQIEHFIQLALKCQIRLDEMFDKSSLQKLDPNQVDILLREFRYLDQGNTGDIDEASLKTILQNFDVTRVTQTTTIIDLNTPSKAHRVSYLPYLKNKSQTSPQQQSRKPDQSPSTRQNPRPQEGDAALSQIPLQPRPEDQGSFRRICSQINRLHLQLTRAREQQ